MTHLMRVLGNGFYLHWPFAGKDKVRGGHGYVLDLDAPFEAEWCKGQMHKLEDAPASAVVSPITHPTALSRISRLRAEEEQAAKIASGEITEEPPDYVAKVAAAGKRKVGSR